MYSKEQLLDIYAAAYFNETGFRLTPQSLDRITFDSYQLTYISYVDTYYITINEFDDNDTYEFPSPINLRNKNSNGWEIC
jgi:hypothetical protein